MERLRKYKFSSRPLERWLQIKKRQGENIKKEDLEKEKIRCRENQKKFIFLQAIEEEKI